MAERFAEVNEQEIGKLLDQTQHQKYRVCLYNKTIIPLAPAVYDELVYDSSSWYINC